MLKLRLDLILLFMYCKVIILMNIFFTSFTKFMSFQGILHQSFCVYSPQQNGVAKHENRHLIETTRTLLLHNQVPLLFWVDVVPTVCFLINRMSSLVLQNKVPYFILFLSLPVYSFPPCVFGCTCFVHIFSPNQNKLFAKFPKCIFLGYSRL